MSAAPLLLSVEESAAQLRIGRSRMFDLIRRGEVLSVKVGGSRRIPYDSLRDYVNRLVTEQGLRTATSPPPDLSRASPFPLPRGDSRVPSAPQPQIAGPCVLALRQRGELRNGGVTTAAAAMEAARRGWAVFPCRPGDKRPAVPDWERRACADPERVARYWPSAQHNIGLACGPSRLVVVDLDTHSPLPDDWRLPGVHDGRDVLALLAEWAGQPWPVTYTVTTPTGGLHLYYTAPDGPGIRNSAARSARSSTSGAAAGTCWPRARCSTSAPTRTTRSAASSLRAAGGTRWPTTATPEPLPAWLAVLAADAGPAARCAPGGRGRAAPGARLQGLIDTVRAGQEGDRNGPLYWAARRAAEMITAGEIDRGTAEEALVAAALEAGLRGGEREARRTFASAMRGGGL